MKRIVLGLSDGVDSAVAAHLLKASGYDVLGVYLINAGERELDAARKNAEEAGITFESLDIRAELKEKVCIPFVDEYLAGRTPSPCPGCNRDVKLNALIRRADELGIEEVATGHYVIKRDGALYMGDPECDQSYMLCMLKRAQLDRLVLPLGGYAKREVRNIAKQLGLSCADKPDSRENCFIRDTDYASYIRIHCPSRLKGAGEALFHGEPFDVHEGIYAYTVGQRWKRDREGRRLYVSRIDPGKNRIELCLWEELFTREVDIGNVSWLTEPPRCGEIPARIRIRHTRWETPDCALTIEGSRVRVVTQTPLRAPAPGQIAALYSENRLIGGGVVESVAADHPMRKANDGLSDGKYAKLK